MCSLVCVLDFVVYVIMYCVGVVVGWRGGICYCVQILGYERCLFIVFVVSADALLRISCLPLCALLLFGRRK